MPSGPTPQRIDYKRATTQEIARHLRLEMWLDESDVATATGTSVRTVRRWLAGESGQAQARHTARLRDLCAVVVILRSNIAPLRPQDIPGWMRRRRADLQGASPLSSLASGHVSAVLAAARDLVAARDDWWSDQAYGARWSERDLVSLVTGASKRTVERWLDGHTTPKPHYAQRLNSLSVVRDAQERHAEAQGTYVTASQMLDWFSTPTRRCKGTLRLSVLLPETSMRLRALPPSRG
jgi:hypothetical protein